MSVNYHFYATLLDSFSWLQKSQKENALEEFIDKINRVERPRTIEMLRGMEFERLVNALAKSKKIPTEPIQVLDKIVSPEIIMDFISDMEHSAQQVFLECQVSTRYGLVRLYGYADDILGDTVFDTKTTKEFELGKYRNNFQHRVYLEALKKTGINQFIYRVTDFENYFEDVYDYHPDFKTDLIRICEQLIEFLTVYRNQITDKKIFGLV